MDKIFLSKPNNVELKLGDCILEISRFNKNDYRIYKIIELKDTGYILFETMASSGSATVRKGYTCSGEYDCLFGAKNCKWLCYYLPAATVLYGKAEERKV